MIMVFLFLKFIYFSESSVIAGVAKFVIHFENNNSERVLSDKSQFLLDAMYIVVLYGLKPQVSLHVITEY